VSSSAPAAETTLTNINSIIVLSADISNITASGQDQITDPCLPTAVFRESSNPTGTLSATGRDRVTMLCDVCAAIDFRELLTPADDIADAEDYQAPSVQHYATSDALLDAAAEGCELCQLFISGGNKWDKHRPDTAGPYQIIADFEGFLHPSGPAEGVCSSIHYRCRLQWDPRIMWITQSLMSHWHLAIFRT